MKHKILSFLTAFAMVFGIIAAPFTNASAAPQAGTPVGPTADTETKAKVTIHKIKVKSTTGFPIEQQEGATEIVGKDGKTKYDGGQIAKENITGFFGDGAEELANVTFTYWTFDSKENYEKMVKDPSSYDTFDEVKALLNSDGKDVKTTENGVETDEITVPANGHKYLWAVEKSKTITDADGKQQTITGGAAVPFGLALPLFKADGTVNSNIHVYPKNTTANEPKVDKDFEGKANAEQDRNEIDNKIKKDVKVGDVQPYDIETIIPAGANYKTAAWTDQMTEGLTFDNNVVVKMGEKGKETDLDKADYKVTPDGNGFILELTESGLNKINNQPKEVRLLVKYSATVNENAKVERQERNDVIFHYGNDPHHGNTPYPTKPKDGKLKVTKDFDNVYGDFAEGEEVEVTLIDAHTGKPVENLPDKQTATVTLKKGTKEDQEHEWHGLDDTRQYKVVEKFKPNDEVTYEKQEDGSVKIIDKKTDNPTPKDPQEPGLVTYGHRFQKVDHEGKGLPNAEFIVKNNITGDADNGKVLAQKEAKDLAADEAAYQAAEKAYKDAVKEGKADTEIAPLKAKRDAAYVKVNTQWKWIDDTADHTGAYVFKSGTDGYFKVTGLMPGAYQLVETKQPDGYAKLTKPYDFTIAEGSTGVTELKGGKLEDAKGFKQIENKKVTIPQTGGIGSIIFVVAGLMIMGLAAYKMKANKEQA
ncbi:MAG: isopeptide-forming domain-containing fimbrial protein [Anaerococcus vaginalis]|uniref:isopeptide-forming domain-containing fimbrial protein n=1 Tax=Anaerococcus vaginalis TaxID=33037 RepID=UPI0029071A6A|nr:isopeptide-forming domain-containing fimbrial protein [Anaerococcus vaginalis]MDU6181454.1 isopeptide-forming domain-containing fimbrial protein [Anaerococcus vaginalis]